MCQLNLNAEKQASEEQDISFKAQISCSTYQETFLLCSNEILPFLQEEPAVSYCQQKWHSFQFLPQETALHIFHVYLHATPHMVHQNPHDTTPPMFPCGEYSTLLSNHVTYLPYHKTYMPHHWKPPMHGQSRSFWHHPTAHIFGPGIHHVKFVVALQPQFPVFHDSLMAFLKKPDRSGSLLHDSSLTFLVYCCFFHFAPLFVS